MHVSKVFFRSLPFAALAGFIGCTTPDSSVSTAADSQQDIALRTAADSLHIKTLPPKAVVCDSLQAHLGLLDSTLANYPHLRELVAAVCSDSGTLLPPPPPPRGPKPDSLKAKGDSLPPPPPPRGPKPDSLKTRGDSLPPPPPPRGPKPDTLRAAGDSLPPPPPPRGPKPDSLRAQGDSLPPPPPPRGPKPDSLKSGAAPDSAKRPLPPPPRPPKK